MKFDNKKVNNLLAEMEAILSKVKLTNKAFRAELAIRKKEAA